VITAADYPDLVALIEEADREGVALLAGLPPGAWDHPVLTGRWRVRDVVAHLIDGAVRRLSFGRDGMTPAPVRARDAEDLVRLMDEWNADWVRASARLSPRLLTEFASAVTRDLAAYLRTLDPDAPALFGVAWAGQATSPTWFDVAREYTERWHHWAQIREAVGAPGLDGPRWTGPLVATGVHALPHGYRTLDAPAGTSIVFHVTGEAGGSWRLVRAEGAWSLTAGSTAAPATTVTLDAETAWRLLFKMLPPDEAAQRASVDGDPRLAAPLFSTLALMAVRD
jgi:hypothetical protein